MNYFSNRKKWMACLILLTFVFTCIVPTNLAGGNSAAEAADVQTVTKADSGIEFQLFNYNEFMNLTSDQVVKNENGEIINYRDWVTYFNFRGDYSPHKPDINTTYDEDGYTANRIKVKPVLNKVNGYPVLAANESYNLEYLFTSGDHAVTAYQDIVNTPLQYNVSTGYYKYDSKQNAVDFSNSTFYLRDYVERTISTAGYSGYADFLPFDTLNTTGHANGVLGTNTDTGQPYHYNIVAENAEDQPDYWFGMTMQADFYQPKNGQVNGEEMVFTFSGDDDVWVFIDDVLVLDLGGTHGVVTGAINFETGAVTQHIDWAGDTGAKNYHWDSAKNATVACTDDCKNCGGYAKSYPTTLAKCFADAGRIPNGGWNEDNTTFADYSNHTIKFFYLERGSSCANCMLTFNLPTLPPDSLTVGKEVPATGNIVTDSLLEDKTYTFRVLQSDANGNAITKTDGSGAPEILIPAGTTYAIWENSVDTKETGTVGADGYFTLEAGQQAVFSNMLSYYDASAGKTHYMVEEITTGEYQVSINDVLDKDAKTGALATDSAQVIVFENEVAATSCLNITKQITSGDEADFIADQEYRLEVTVGGALLPIGTAYKIGETPKTVSETGVVTVKAGETAKIDGLLKETTYTVRELDLVANGAEPDYYLNGAKVDTVNGTINNAGEQVNVTVTNSSTQEYISVSGQKIWEDNDDEPGNRPDKVTLYLFRDGVAIGQTTETALDWSYHFDNLPRYATNATVTGEEIADGHEYRYLVAEEKLTNYAPSYSVPTYDDKGNATINITNTYGEAETETGIKVTKTWDDNNDELGKRPESITLKLFNGVDEEPVCTTTASYDYTFTNLPIYNASGEPYVYTVTEEPVEHYLSAIVPTADGFKITNTLYTGQAGQFTVNKQVEGELQPPADFEYNFNLQIKAEVVDWDAVLVSKKMELEEAHENAKIALDNANSAVENATADFIENVKLTTPSAYQYVLVDGGNALFTVDRTSPSAYIWESVIEVTIDQNADKSIVEDIADAIKTLAQKFSNLLDKPTVFLQLLHEKVDVTTPSAIVFDKVDAQKLFEAEKTRIAAVELEKSTGEAFNNFDSEVATPSAITLKMLPSSNKLEEQTIKLDPDKDARDAEGFYNVPFTLFKDTGYTFTVEATTGANIDYKISEIEWPTENYEETDINVNGDTTLSDTRFTGLYGMTAEKANTFIFNNIYKTPEDTPYVPPTEQEKDLPEENNPDENLTDPDVPKGTVEVPGEPLDELNDPEIPLGDAPATGDTNNAVPFVVLMLAAAAGLVLTRRKFN